VGLSASRVCANPTIAVDRSKAELDIASENNEKNFIQTTIRWDLARHTTISKTMATKRRMANTLRISAQCCHSRSTEDEDAMVMEADGDGGSVATTMGVMADTRGLFVLRSSRELESVDGSVTGNSLVLPGSLTQDDGDLMDDDDISTLTECSMDEEDDNFSQATQNTSWTVVTTGTDSTTVPTRNFASAGDITNKSQMNGKRTLMKNGVLLSNSKFKRRRIA
jgi:hypothetical protein